MKFSTAVEIGGNLNGGGAEGCFDLIDPYDADFQEALENFKELPKDEKIEARLSLGARCLKVCGDENVKNLDPNEKMEQCRQIKIERAALNCLEVVIDMSDNFEEARV